MVGSYRRLAWHVFVVTLGLLVGLHGSAARASTYSGITISRMDVFQASSGAAPGVVILFSPAIADTEGCTKSGQGYAYIDFTSTLQPDGKTLYATVLAAWLGGRSVDLIVSGCEQGYYPLVYQVQVH